MAKGDDARSRNQIDKQGGLAQNQLDNMRNNFIPQNQDLQNRAQVAYDQAGKDYSNIQGGLQDYVNQSYNRDLTGTALDRGSYGGYGGYEDFSKTGGYTPEQIAAMRARGEGAVRSTFDASKRRLEQENRIQGGSSNARTAALGKLTRDTAHEVGDVDTNLEAQLADSIRQGKLAGLAGMTGIDTSRMGLGINANQQTMGNVLGGLNAQGNLYGTRPGQASMYGDLLGQSNSQWNQIQQLQQQLAQMMIQGQLGASQLPGKWESTMGRIGDIFNLGGKVLGGIGGFGGFPGMGSQQQQGGSYYGNPSGGSYGYPG